MNSQKDCEATTAARAIDGLTDYLHKLLDTTESDHDEFISRTEQERHIVYEPEQREEIKILLRKILSENIYFARENLTRQLEIFRRLTLQTRDPRIFSDNLR